MANTKKILTLDDYQYAARRTAIYPHMGSNLIYTVMGLNGETGELANKVSKQIRSFGLEIGDKVWEKDLDKLRAELGDILWFVALTATELDTTLNQIGMDNIDKLSGRVKSNNIEGEGDDRGSR